MLKHILVLAVFLTIAQSRAYPMFKQCDPAWKNDQLGTSSNTICSAGCLITSASMALAGTVKPEITPATLNKWLTQNGGYVSGDLFVWASINSFGLIFQGKVANSQIKSKLDQGYVVICNVHQGKHWVLAYGYIGDNILINDPNYQLASYALSEIVDWQNGVYSIKSEAFHNILEKTENIKTALISQFSSQNADGRAKTYFIGSY